jgi:metallophosphoesterase (TIGR03767 family)
MTLSRREFLKAAGITGTAAAIVPAWWPDWIDLAYASPRDLTTLGRTIVRGAVLNEGSSGFKYYRLAEGPGEPYVKRNELGKRPGRADRDLGKGRRALLSFVHFTDIHIVDAESPARVEFLDRYDDKQCSSAPFTSAYRPQEALTVQVLEAMIRQVRAVRRSPITGKRIRFAVCTGDNIDNEQFNELRWFIDTMDGGKGVTPGSGSADYEGVMAADWGDAEYWHPDEGVFDKYKDQYGFPEYPGLLQAATKPFEATGIGMPWLQTFGNHDGLMQGNAPRNDAFERAATGSVKVTGPPPGANPCDELSTLLANPAAFTAAPANPVTADPNRKIIHREAYIAEMFKTTGFPKGHGFTDANLPKDDGTLACYWHTDQYPLFRIIGLDTVNPGGLDSGSIGDRQLKWLEERLVEVSARHYDADGKEVTTNNANRYVILFSHHGLRSLNNEASASEDPQQEGINDQPRHLADDVAALVHRFPNVIAWVNGHTHNNIVEPRKDPAGKTQGFWDIGTAAHIDWNCQTRLIDVVDNRNDTLSIYCTMVDHAAPPVPSPTKDPVLYLASVSRELAANDYHYGYESKGAGKVEDRNVELVIKAPFEPPRPKKTTSRRELASALVR